MDNFNEKLPEEIVKERKRLRKLRNDRHKRWIKKHPFYNRNYWQKNKERLRDKKIQWNRNYWQKIKKEVINYYGGKCACCGEKYLEFLCIDHINGGGSKHRKIIKARGGAFLRFLRSINYPKGYQVLCHNCNASLAHHGYCPHKPKIKRIVIKRI